MLSYPVSFAATFTRNNEPDPFCAVCFFAEAQDEPQKDSIEEYLASNIFPKIAQVAIKSNKETVLMLIYEAADEVSEQFGVHCWGQLTDTQVSIFPKRNAPGG